MNECCKKTMIKMLEEIIFNMELRQLQDCETILKTLKYALSMLR